MIFLKKEEEKKRENPGKTLLTSLLLKVDMKREHIRTSMDIANTKVYWPSGPIR